MFHTCEHKSQLTQYHPSCFQSILIGLRRAIGHGMKYTWLGCLLVGNLLFAGTQDSELNVNKRYTVDTVIVAGKGWQTNLADQQNERLSSGLRKDLLALIGQKLNPGILDGLATRLKKEFSAREVSHHVLRADVPDHVRVEFEVKQSSFGGHRRDISPSCSTIPGRAGAAPGWGDSRSSRTRFCSAWPATATR